MTDDGQGMLGAGNVDSQSFFESKKAAAVLKHAILKGYIPPFAQKTGKWMPDKRVVIMDGFAGAGRYEDGRPGSPAIVAEVARKVPERVLDCYFVEKDRTNYERLREVLSHEGDAIKWTAWPGTAEEHLGEVLTRASGSPLFLFIDPFGIGPEFSQLTDIFRRRPGGRGRPATEMLFRIDAGAVRRTLGVHLSPKFNPARDAQLRRVDLVAGGSWWRDDHDGVLSGEPYLEWFFSGYVGHLAQAVGCHGWYTDVKQKPGQQPSYYLVFLTRHTDGVEIFGDTLSRALKEWRWTVFQEAVAAQEATGQLMLFDPEQQFAHDERQLEAEWHDALERNVRNLLRRYERFYVHDQFSAVFGETIGRAREMHLREALRRLEVAGVTSSDSKGKKLYRKLVVRAPGAQP